MKEIGPEHPLSYRKEVVRRLFGYVKSADSFFVIGGASAGKTRLLDFIMREDVQKHYLEERAQTTWLIRVDLNRHHAGADWTFYELLISSMMLGSSRYEDTQEIFEQLANLDEKVMEGRDDLQALRFFELAVHRLCVIHDLNVCFLLDEFDGMYRTMSKEIFAQLRAVRDANKNQVCYGLFLRDLPERLRPPSDNESFYELLSHRMIGLGPLNYDDATRALRQMEERREFRLQPTARDVIISISGGHPGLLQALLGLHIKYSVENEQMGNWNWLIKQEFVQDECAKIWASLSPEEQSALLQAVHNAFERIPPHIFKLITAKGLLQKKDQSYKIFSPIFERYLQDKAQPA
ncbi:MAG: hypothetical protein Fur0043_03360 [Anaerolineales bacterium]